MDRIKEISRLKSIEQSIKDLKNYKIGIDTSYFHGGKLSLHVDSKDFNFKEDYNDVKVEFSEELLLKFIQAQIEIFERESKEILKRLTNES